MASPAGGRHPEKRSTPLRFLNATGRSIAWLVAAILLAAGPGSAQTKAGTKARQVSSSTKKSSKHSKRRGRRRGQKKIESARTRQIQQALAKAHYFEGEPSGVLDAKTEDALRRFQAANGWQTKVVPDSRALIKLGLGPNHDGLINPETAMTEGPAKPAKRISDLPKQ
jgi:peptidoglycan hydrolase-like protein with peptidoglycan-binding domain